MIEVEKKFLLSDNQQTQLLHGAEFLFEKVITDTYFDDDDYSLTKADLWLRQRNGSYELKAPLSSGQSSETNQYYEIDDEVEIATALALPTNGQLVTELARRGIHGFVTCNTARSSYRKDGFTIDIDSATYNDSAFTYGLAEIELLVGNESQVGVAEQRIVEFAQTNNLDIHSAISGKIVAFLQQQNSEHYKALVEAKVVS